MNIIFYYFCKYYSFMTNSKQLHYWALSGWSECLSGVALTDEMCCHVLFRERVLHSVRKKKKKGWHPSTLFHRSVCFYTSFLGRDGAWKHHWISKIVDLQNNELKVNGKMLPKIDISCITIYMMLLSTCFYPLSKWMSRMLTVPKWQKYYSY